MRLRDGWFEFVGWSGLVWFGVLLHTRVYLTCLHGLNATNEVVMCFFLFFLCALQGGTIGTEIKPGLIDKKRTTGI